MVTIDAQALEQIAVKSRDIRFWRTVLTLLAGMLAGIGWITYQVFAVTWRALTWTYAAVKYGWDQARLQNAKKRPAR